jgi:hypothetical protein
MNTLWSAPRSTVENETAVCTCNRARMLPIGSLTPQGREVTAAVMNLNISVTIAEAPAADGGAAGTGTLIEVVLLPPSGM